MSPQLTPFLSLDTAATSYSAKVMPFNVLTSTATELGRLLDQRQVTAVDLAKAYMQQIHKHNKAGANLHAIISVVPEQQLLEAAARSDKERADGNVRSAYHGISFVVKDNIWTDSSFGLSTTCGAWALRDAKAKANADVVQTTHRRQLIASPRQSQSPYVTDGIDPTDTVLGHSTPAGSSAGSAIAVAAGMAPFALGTETDGSILQPSDWASVYSIKPTFGKISTQGCLPGAAVTDVVGPMTKSPQDLATLLDILTPLQSGSHVDFLNMSLSGLRIGFLDTKNWLSGPAVYRPNEGYIQQLIETVDEAINLVEKSGGRVKRNVTLRKLSPDDDRMFTDIISNDLRKGFVGFAAGLNGAAVKTLADLVHYNREHAADCLPPGTSNQQILENAVDAAELSEQTYKDYVTKLQQHNGAEGLEATLRENDIDVVIGPATGRGTSVAIIAGCPVGTLPLGYAHFNGRAFGLTIMAPANAESLIVRVMGVWDSLVFKRQPPLSL